ncbi:MAG: 23S rRNA (adenine(2503)-C(2))-methyltransferase RlmN [Acidobacteriaceae bacterium]|nr:23S rRNA (adenine(2503)-C(2))-methyltransferase RlmN [Acidobacteriaceae bacterium]
MQAEPLFGKNLDELTTIVGGDTRRARQLWRALYRDRIATLDPLAARLRALLPRDAEVGLPVIAQTAISVDGTERYLMRLADGETIETVWMPEGEADGFDGSDLRNRGRLADQGYQRATICISSQVGCAVNCQFCLTAKLGVKRNLSAGEIAGQVAAVLNRHHIRVGVDRINLVLMGMGEPFLNYDSVMTAIGLIVQGIGIPASRITVSTSGIEPAIRRFAAETIRPNLALSLNAPNDAIREQVMPINRKWKIAELLEAVKTIPLGKRGWINVEYVLLGGINDQPEHALQVLELLRDVQAKVNLIVWNPGPEIAYRQPEPADVTRFHRILVDNGMPTFTRRPRGRDIYAACGQLKRTLEEPELVALS